MKAVRAVKFGRVDLEEILAGLDFLFLFYSILLLLN